MKQEIAALRAEIAGLSADTPAEAEALRVRYLGKKGPVQALFARFREVAPADKKEMGQLLNALKTEATERINALKEACAPADDPALAALDLTRTAYPIALGSRHPISMVRNEICDIFGRMGLSIAEGPEVEDDWLVF